MFIILDKKHYGVKMFLNYCLYGEKKINEFQDGLNKQSTKSLILRKLELFY